MRPDYTNSTPLSGLTREPQATIYNFFELPEMLGSSPSMRRHYNSIIALISLIGIFFSFPTHASVVKKVESYLSNLTTLTADFTQKAPDGTVSSGKLSLKRPKQMRWQYHPPTPVLMVTRGNYLTYYDYELNQVSDIPLDDTLLGILSKQEIDFDSSNITVTGHHEKDGFVTVILEQKDAPENGSLGIVLKKSPMTLKHLIVTDATQQVTHITLTNLQRDMVLEDKVFEFRDPRVGGKNKKSDRTLKSGSETNLKNN